MNRSPVSFPSPLHADTPVDTSRSIPYAGGVARDGSKIYIDKRIPAIVHVDGKPIHAHAAIGFHERVEFPLMHEMGMHYDDAHQIATAMENHFIRHHYGVDPRAYQAALRTSVGAARQAHEGSPADLDEKPYRDSGELHMMEPRHG